MTPEEIRALINFVGSAGFGAVVGGALVFLILKSFLPSYLAEKGKNLATREDVARITDEIERVRSEYAERLQALGHQNAILIEEIRGRGQLRLAAAERRLQAHQEAFALWRKLISTVHTHAVSDTVIECQDWFNHNCLYLTGRARDAFSEAYFSAMSHKSLLDDRSNAGAVTANWERLMKLGPEIVAGAELPPLGEGEIQRLQDVKTPSE